MANMKKAGRSHPSHRPQEVSRPPPNSTSGCQHFIQTLHRTLRQPIDMCGQSLRHPCQETHHPRSRYEHSNVDQPDHLEAFGESAKDLQRSGDNRCAEQEVSMPRCGAGSHGISRSNY